jgi:solute carrier family 25 protein 33/36
MGDVIPNRTPSTGEEKPEAKPFAHFVAGGYVTEESTADADHTKLQQGF